MTKSMLESMALTLRRAAAVMLLAFVLAAAGAIQYLHAEDDPALLRYVTATAPAGTFLVAAVIAWTGSMIIRSLARVRETFLDAFFEPEAEFEN